VFVACGEKDPALSAAEATGAHLTTLGATVTFTTWPGIGHKLPDLNYKGGETSHRTWLLAQADLADSGPASRPAVTTKPAATGPAPPPQKPQRVPWPETGMDNSKPWKPGNIFDIQDKEVGEDGYYRVYLPAEYDPDKAWPVIFNYHALGGAAETHTIRRITEGKRYIVVGMSYSKPGLDSFELLATVDVNIFHHVLAALKEHVNIDEKKLYVGGFSKGGFYSCELMRLLPELAGAIVLGAGTNGGDHKWPDLTGKHIYVGVGEKDGYKNDATESFFTGLGATVTHEQWPGLGHTIGDMTTLRKWLVAQAELPNQSATQPASAAQPAATQPWAPRPEDYMDSTRLWQPGNVFDVQDPQAGEDGFFRVFVPADYDADTAWPVIFYYHGLTEKPSTAVIRQATDAKRYIVVGMSYGPSGLDGDVQIFHHVLDSLKEHLNVDEKKLYLSGFSKGGFFSCELLRLLAADVAGIVVLGMGTDGGGREWPDLTGKHIFVGVGENDQYKNDATGPFFIGLGATVTLEQWPGIGHAVGDLAGLRAWLMAQAERPGEVTRSAANPVVTPATQPARRTDGLAVENESTEASISYWMLGVAGLGLLVLAILIALIVSLATNRRSNVR